MATKKRRQINVAVLVALIGLGGTLITAFLGYLGIKYQTEKPISVTQTAQATSLSINNSQINQSTPTPTSAPFEVSSLFELSILKDPKLEINGLITESVDNASGQDRISNDNIDKNIWVVDASPIYPVYFEIILTGKNKKPIYITNRIPIKIVSYINAPEESDIWTIPVGGGSFTWVFSTEIKNNSVLSQDSIVWASYPTDIIERFQELKKIKEITGDTESLPIEITSFPTSIQNIYVDNSAEFPDFFTLVENELLVMGMGVYFSDPGIYTIQPGIEFVVDGQKSIKWLEKTIEVYVPNNYTLWVTDYQDSTEQGIIAIVKCEYTKENGHVCQY